MRRSYATQRSTGRVQEKGGEVDGEDRCRDSKYIQSSVDVTSTSLLILVTVSQKGSDPVTLRPTHVAFSNRHFTYNHNHHMNNSSLWSQGFAQNWLLVAGGDGDR